MQVQHQPHQPPIDFGQLSPSNNLEVQGEDLPIEGLIFPQLISKKGQGGQRCFYCLLKSGFSVNFTSLDQYGKHVLYNHEGYSIYVFDKDVRRYKKELKALRRSQMDYPKQFRQPKPSS
jgi:hypothetical protein